MSNINVRVNAYSESPTKTVAKVRGFEITIDEPADLGGSNEGPNPVEYSLVALSGCLNVISHLVAKEMDFELRGVKINLSSSLNSKKLFGKDTEKRAGLKGIEVKINPDSDADTETLTKWLEAVKERCPVSDNLSNSTPVDIVLR